MLQADAYSAGVAVGALLPLVAGAVLVVLGVRRRRAAAPLTAPSGGTSWGAEPGDDPPPADQISGAEPVSRRGGWLIAGGAALIAVSLLAVVGRGIDRPEQRRVALPESVLGLARNPAATQQISGQALASVPADLIEPQAAVYGDLPHAVLVIAARAETSRPADQLDEFRKGLEEAGGELTNGRDVPAGPLGGAARCWDSTVAGAHPAVCVFADGGSLLATVDFLGGDTPAAAKRGLQVREAAVSEAG